MVRQKDSQYTQIPRLVWAEMDTVVVAVDIDQAVSLRFLYPDATCLAMLTRPQPDVLVLACCQSYRGGESTAAQSSLPNRDHWPLAATCRTGSSCHFFEQGITLPAGLMMVP